MSTITFVHPTPDSTRDELATSLRHLNEQAKDLSRRGYAGYASERYATLHANINVLVTSWQLAD